MDEQDYVALARASLVQRLGAAPEDVLCQSWQRERMPPLPLKPGEAAAATRYRYFIFLRYGSEVFQFRAEAGQVRFLTQLPL